MTHPFDNHVPAYEDTKEPLRLATEAYTKAQQHVAETAASALAVLVRTAIPTATDIIFHVAIAGDHLERAWAIAVPSAGAERLDIEGLYDLDSSLFGEDVDLDAFDDEINSLIDWIDVYGDGQQNTVLIEPAA